MKTFKNYLSMKILKHPTLTGHRRRVGERSTYHSHSLRHICVQPNIDTVLIAIFGGLLCAYECMCALSVRFDAILVGCLSMIVWTHAVLGLICMCFVFL